MDSALSDISIVDASQIVAGPVCTAFLADLGADVVKIEPPSGEMARGGPWELDGQEINPAFLHVNRNKRSLAVDLKSEEGQDAVQRLVESADVFVQNWRPGVAERLGVDYETLRSRNEDLIYAHITGYGETGPAVDRPGMDVIIQHLTGFSSMLGFEDHPPTQSQCSLADYFAGYNAALSIMGALYNRLGDGSGQKIDVSLLESLMHNMDSVFEFYHMLGMEPRRAGRTGYAQPDVRYGAVEAEDGWVCVALLLYNDHMWEGYCDLLDRPDLLEADEYQTAKGRREDIAELTAEFEEWITDYAVEEVVPMLNDAGIPAAQHNHISKAAELDQVEHRDVFVDVEHPEYDRELTLTESPLSLSETPAAIRDPAPMIGEHTRQVLLEAGYSEDTVEDLLDRGVVVTERPAE